MGVAQCLRCQKLFKPKDNSSKSCRYHPKGREITEQYDPNGKLVHVLYKWACCKRVLDSMSNQDTAISLNNHLHA
jgi:hypothetical protein